jgi:hypothetical protein
LDRLAYIGVDLFENFEPYAKDDPDFWSRIFMDETQGAAFVLNLGDNIKRGDWRFRYGYARVEWLAAMTAYSTTGLGRISRTNIAVHDFRADYSMTDQWKVSGRIVPGRTLIGSSKSTRFRIDLTRYF